LTTSSNVVTDSLLSWSPVIAWIVIGTSLDGLRAVLGGDDHFLQLTPRARGGGRIGWCGKDNRCARRTQYRRYRRRDLRIRLIALPPENSFVISPPARLRSSG